MFPWRKIFIYCPLTVHFSYHSCCFFILYFISHSAFWKHRVSFWLIFLCFCNASVSCMIYAIQTHTWQAKLCLAALDCLRSYVQHLVDVSLPDLFSSRAARGGVGVASYSSQAFPVGEHSVLEKQFSVSIFLLGHSTSVMWLICVSLFVLWPSTPRKKYRPPPQVLESSHSTLGFLWCSRSIRCWPFHHSSFDCCWF